MDRKQPPSFDAPDDERASPDYLRQGDASTETIDLNSLFTEDVTASGSFDIRDDIWATTFGKVLQALPIPVLLIDQSRNIVVANQAWTKIATGYEKILGNPFARLFAKRSVALAGESLVKKVFSTRRTTAWESLLEIDNNKIWGRFTFRSIRIKDRRFLLVLLEDLSLEKKQVLLDRKYKKELKKRVEDRTEDLRKKNEDLVREIADRRRSEAALRESEERFRAIFESHHAVLLIIDPETGRIEEGSPGACAFYGYDREELKKKKITEINTLTPEQIFNQMQIAKVQHRRYFDFRHRLASGEVRDVEVCSGPIIVGGRTLLFSVINDVTERKRAEEALRESQQRLDLVLKGADLGLWDLDVSSGEAVVNERAASMLGYSLSEIEATFSFWASLIHPNDKPVVLGLFDDHLEGRSTVLETEYRALSKSGDWKWILGRGKVVERGQDGRALRMTGTFMDITERKRAEAELRESEEKHRTILENIKEGYYEVDIAGNMTFCNESLSRIHGCTRQELIGINNRQYMTADMAKDVYETFNRVYATGNLTEMSDWEIIRRDGTRRIVEGSVSLIKDSEGKPCGFRGIARDITERKRAEEALRTSEAQLSNAVMMAHLGPWEYDVTKDLFTFNDHFYKLFRTTAEQVGGYTMSSAAYARRFVHPDDMSVVGNEIRKSIEATDPDFSQQLEHRIVYADGEIGHISVRIFLVKDELGRTVRTYGVNQDITERKKVEESLKETSALLNTLLNAIPSPLFYKDTDGRYLGLNKSFEEFFGKTHQELVGKSVFDIAPRDLAEVYHAKDLELLHNPGVQVYDSQIKDAHGVVHDVVFHKSTFSDPQGHVLGLIGVILDITERKRTEEALKESERQYRTLFEDSLDGVYSVLRDGIIRDANPSFCELFGYTREEMIGKDIRELYSDPADRSKFQKEIEEKGFVKDYEVRFRKRDGTEVNCVLTSSVYFAKDGSIAGYRGISRDLTAQKGLERQLLQAQKMEAIGTLAGGIAHDFNNILQVVCGFSEIILMGKGKGDSEYEDLQKVLSAGKRGADLVQRLLTFSRKTEINPKPLNLNQQIQRVESILERTIPKIIKIDSILSDRLSAVTADPTQIEQVLMNLAVNARDAMPEGGRLIFETSNVTLDENYCNTHLGAKPGDYVLLTVSDTGQGMDKKTLEHIFEPFFSTKPTGMGTGLGLAMVYGIVKQHNGYITCYSEPGAGTAFKLYFPVTEMKVESSVQIEERRLPVGSETILLVDDEELIRDLAKRILSRAGYTVLTAANGREAVETYEKKGQTVSLIVLDLIMPEMDGKQCLKELIEINPGARVVVASGYSADGPTKEALQGGAKGFVSKPFDMGQLLQTVRSVLDAE